MNDGVVQEITGDAPELTAAEKAKLEEERRIKEREATRKQAILEQQEIRRQQQQQKKLAHSIPIASSPARGDGAATATASGANAQEEPSMLSFIGSVWQVCASRESGLHRSIVADLQIAGGHGGLEGHSRYRFRCQHCTVGMLCCTRQRDIVNSLLSEHHVAVTRANYAQSRSRKTAIRNTLRRAYGPSVHAGL